MVKVDLLRDPDLAVPFGMQGSFATEGYSNVVANPSHYSCLALIAYKIRINSTLMASTFAS
jgi:hypothetical protein